LVSARRWWAAVVVAGAACVAALLLRDVEVDVPLVEEAGRAEPPAEPVAMNLATGRHSHERSEEVEDVRERYVRAEGEWRGMVHEPADVWPCGTAGCSMARACVAGVCVPCAESRECLGGELCVLGSCVLAEKVECDSRTDCDEGELCVLTGYTAGDPRGNGDMRAVCLGSDGGNEPSPEEAERVMAQQVARALPNPDAAVEAPEARALALIRGGREPAATP
jgi:hypothetical protein